MGQRRIFLHVRHCLPYTSTPANTFFYRYFNRPDRYNSLEKYSVPSSPLLAYCSWSRTYCLFDPPLCIRCAIVSSESFVWYLFSCSSSNSSISSYFFIVSFIVQPFLLNKSYFLFPMVFFFCDTIVLRSCRASSFSIRIVFLCSSF